MITCQGVDVFPQTFKCNAGADVMIRLKSGVIYHLCNEHNSEFWMDHKEDEADEELIEDR